MGFTKITIEPYLAEYLRGKYATEIDEPVIIPDNTDLYHLIWSLMAIRRKNEDPADANLHIALPKRRIGKDPRYHNYLSPRSAKLIEDEIKRMFNRELHTVLEDNDANVRPVNNIDVVYRFMNDYMIESITDGALLKNFYRYRENIRKKKYRRKYTKRS